MDREIKIRSVARSVPGKPTSDGAGIKLTRVLSLRETKDFDPFLMLDWFDSTQPSDYLAGFPWHPHRGIETVTFLYAGSIAHADSLGHAGVIGDGDCQWMTAGSGIIHQEMPQESPLMRGLQLWVNLGASEKMTEPAYREIKADDVPETAVPGGAVRVIAGEFNGLRGPTTGVSIQPMFLDIRLDAGAELTVPTPLDETVFCFLVDGGGFFTGLDGYSDGHAAHLYTEGEAVRFKAGDKGLRLLLLAGRPLHEPIAWGGPIVMNTREELETAFRELDEGTFIRGAKKDG